MDSKSGPMSVVDGDGFEVEVLEVPPPVSRTRSRGWVSVYGREYVTVPGAGAAEDDAESAEEGVAGLEREFDWASRCC